MARAHRRSSGRRRGDAEPVQALYPSIDAPALPAGYRPVRIILSGLEAELCPLLD
jgi:hypothetical protein